MCHTRELAFQISKEYERFSKYLPSVRVGVFFGGMNISNDEKLLKSSCPHVVVATPGRALALVRSRKLQLKHIKHFVLDECDKMLEQLGGSSSLPRPSPCVAAWSKPRRPGRVSLECFAFCSVRASKVVPKCNKCCGSSWSVILFDVAVPVVGCRSSEKKREEM